LTDMGIHDGLAEAETKDVRLINYEAVIAFGISWPAVFFCQMAIPTGYYAWGLFFIQLNYGLAIFFNHLRWYTTAKFTILLVAEVATFWGASVFGEQANLHYVYIIIIFATTVTFRQYERRYLWLALLMVGGFLALLYATDFSLFKPNLLADRALAIAQNTSLYLCLMGSISMSLFFISKFEAQQILREKFHLTLQARFDELQKLNAELDRFVYSISHDLRAPIASVRGLVHLGQRAQDLAEAQQYFDLQDKSLQKLNSFIADILDYSRNNRTELQPQAVDFLAELAGMLDLQALSERGQAVALKLDVEQAGAFQTDRHRLAVVLNNLVGNAVRYHNPGVAEPWVRVRVAAGPGLATITVADNGIGIGAEYLPRIFDMFFRATDRATGSGLGLYIVKEVVDKLGGTIQVESEVGKGTVFTVEVPNLLA
jgi:signal transduction histidine kinase